MSTAQIIGYKWRQMDKGTWQPQLLVNNGSVSRIPLWGHELNLELGKRICTGHWLDGNYVACPSRNIVDYDRICDSCRTLDDWYGCIQCSGEGECKNPKRRSDCERNDYWIYLAAFDGQIKVGISYQRRFFERLIEQGADFGVRLLALQDGSKARQLEQTVAKTLNLPDRISGRQKHGWLLANPNRSVMAISKALTRLADSSIGMPNRTEIYDFRENYRLEALARHPTWLELSSGMKVGGRVISAKGNIIVLQNGTGTHAINAHSLVGFEVSGLEGASEHKAELNN